MGWSLLISKVGLTSINLCEVVILVPFCYEHCSYLTQVWVVFLADGGLLRFSSGWTERGSTCRRLSDAQVNKSI